VLQLYYLVIITQEFPAVTNLRVFCLLVDASVASVYIHAVHHFLFVSNRLVNTTLMLRPLYFANKNKTAYQIKRERERENWKNRKKCM